MNFTENFSVSGKWGYPGTPSNEWLFGELIYNKDTGIKLILQGHLFEKQHMLDLKLNVVIPSLVGETKDHYYSLFELEGYEEGNMSWTITTLNGGYFFRNGQWLVKSQAEIYAITFTTDFFRLFLRDKLPKTSAKHNDNNIEISYKYQEPITIIDDDWANVYFYFQYSTSFSLTKSFQLDTYPYLTVEYKKPLSLSKAVIDLHFLKDFFLFFSTRRISFSRVLMVTKDNEGNNTDIEFLCRDKATPFNAEHYQSDVLLSYSEIESSFSKLFHNWIKNKSFNTVGLSLYMQVRYINFPSPIPAILNLIFALETLHIHFFDHAPFSDEELTPYRQLKKETIKTLSKSNYKLATKVNQCLSHVNTLSFSERLNALIDANAILLKDFLYDQIDFVKRVKKQRNFLAHNHADKEGPYIPENTYLYFIAVLRTIYEYAYLKASGLPEESLNRMHKRINHLRDIQIQKLSILNKLK